MVNESYRPDYISFVVNKRRTYKIINSYKEKTQTTCNNLYSWLGYVFLKTHENYDMKNATVQDLSTLNKNFIDNDIIENYKFINCKSQMVANNILNDKKVLEKLAQLTQKKIDFFGNKTNIIEHLEIDFISNTCYDWTPLVYEIPDKANDLSYYSSCFPYLKKLSINTLTKNPINWRHFKEMKNLVIENAYNHDITNLPPLLEKLQICNLKYKSCINISNLHNLQDLKIIYENTSKLDIKDCKSLTILKIYKYNYNKSNEYANNSIDMNQHYIPLNLVNLEKLETLHINHYKNIKIQNCNNLKRIIFKIDTIEQLYDIFNNKLPINIEHIEVNIDSFIDITEFIESSKKIDLQYLKFLKTIKINNRLSFKEQSKYEKYNEIFQTRNDVIKLKGKYNPSISPYSLYFE